MKVKKIVTFLKNDIKGVCLLWDRFSLIDRQNTGKKKEILAAPVSILLLVKSKRTEEKWGGILGISFRNLILRTQGKRNLSITH